MMSRRPKRSTVAATTRSHSASLVTSAPIARHSATGLADRSGGGLRLLVGLVDDRDVGAGAGEGPRHGRADRAAAAGDERDAAVEAEDIKLAHRAPLRVRLSLAAPDGRFTRPVSSIIEDTAGDGPRSTTRAWTRDAAATVGRPASRGGRGTSRVADLAGDLVRGPPGSALMRLHRRVPGQRSGPTNLPTDLVRGARGGSDPERHASRVAAAALRAGPRTCQLTVGRGATRARVPARRRACQLTGTTVADGST